MRRELLKDEAVGKIAEDRKKEAFLKSIEDREEVDDDELEPAQTDTQDQDSPSQQVVNAEVSDAAPAGANGTADSSRRKRPLELSTAEMVNRLPPALRRASAKSSAVNRKPSTLVEIRDSVSFLIEEPDSQSATPDFNSSDDEEQEAEAYVNLDRHLQAVDENGDDDGEDLGDFIVDDSQEAVFKIPQLPTSRASFGERRTKGNVIDRLSLLRQASSSSSSSASSSSKMAFFTSKSGSAENIAFKGPSLLRRATTNSSLGTAAGSNVSATGVTVATERGAADQEKDMIRKGAGGRRNAVNYRVKPKEEQMQGRIAARKGNAKAKAGGSGFLGGLFRGNSWD